MSRLKRALCPYCGFTNNYPNNMPTKSIQTCDSDEGGCDKDYVVIVTESVLKPSKSYVLTQEVTVSSYKIGV